MVGIIENENSISLRMLNWFAMKHSATMQSLEIINEDDVKVEPGEVVAQHGLLFWKLELLGSEGGHARLDAASAERDEEQADERDGPTQKRQKGNSETQMSKHILRNYLSKK